MYVTVWATVKEGQIDGEALAERGEAVVISDTRMHRQIVTKTVEILCSQPEATL